MFDKAIFQHIKSGQLLHIKQGRAFGILGKPSVEALQELAKKDTVESVILLPEQRLLQNYVLEVPEVAWDLIEYSEKTLELILPQGRTLPACFLREASHIAIRIEAKGEMHKLLFSMGSPLLLIRPLSQSDTLPLLSPDDKTLNLPLEFEWKMIPDKIIKLGLHGEIKFLKK